MLNHTEPWNALGTGVSLMVRGTLVPQKLANQQGEKADRHKLTCRYL